MDLFWISFKRGPSWPNKASLVAQWVKHLPIMRETRVWSLGWEDPLEKEMATHSSTLAWKIPWTEKPGRLQSMGLQRVGHDWATFLSFLSFHDLKWKWKFLSRVWLFETSWTRAFQAPLSMEFSSKKTEVFCHSLLQEIFPTQGSNSGLPHCRWILYCLSH